MKTETTTETTEKLGTATYSPEDNKLRFTPFSRLSKDDYNRARSAGFIWAPKQEIFVAPMWTADREDLMLEWCGDIDDEDTSLVERAEQRAERFEDYSDKRQDDAERARSAVESIAGNIPFGQPILVGHHSQRRAERDAEKIENGMRRAVKMWETSKYWEDRAKGAIRHALYKERPDVRARRIKKIEADKRKQERNRAENERALNFWNGGFKLKHRETGETRPLEISEANRETIAKYIGSDSSLGYLPVCKHPSLNQSWHAWDVLRPDGERYQECPSMTIAEVQEKALSFYPQLIAHCNRWIAHYENRLTYERAMLAADGGTASDQTGPEVGGAVRCWASPGYGKGWAFIQKVNKVSVTIHDEADYPREDGKKRIFRRIMPFDKLHEVMTKAQVDAAKADGSLKECHGGTGFYLFAPDDKAAAPTRDEERWTAHHEAVAAKSEEEKQQAAVIRAREYERLDAIRAAAGAKSICAVTGKLTFEDNICPDGPICQDERRKAGIEPSAFEAMRENLKAGVKVVSAPQLFPTPPDLAAQMVERAFEGAGYCVQICAEMNERCRVLEPSAGTGNLIKAVSDHAKTPGNLGNYELVAVEVNPSLAKAIDSRLLRFGDKVIQGDFLQQNGNLGKFDRILMNPPFADGQDIAHIKHAINFLNPGGRLVAICANGPRQQEQLQPLADEWIDLPAGSFKESGTMVNAAMLVINR